MTEATSSLAQFDDTEALITLRDWLRFAVSRFNEAQLFFGHGTDNAYDEAVWLILHSLHLPLDRLEPFLDASLTDEEKVALAALLKRRIGERIPAAYLAHEAWLAGERFYVDERVIVPRSFIAHLLSEQLAPWLDEAEGVEAVLDLCTGSGCLAILAAQAFPQAHVDATDLSADALDVARRNIAEHGLEERVTAVQSNMFDALDGRHYDLIISNPPYVNAAAVAALPPEYLHEPALALGSGDDGLDATRVILKHAAAHLKRGGLLVVEIGHNRDALEAAFPDLPFIWLDTEGPGEYVFCLKRDDLA